MSIVNLNKARKARARTDRQKTAQANSVKFGRTKAERVKETAEVEAASRHLDGHKREP